LEIKLLQIVRINREAMALAVETKNLVLVLTVKAFVRKVLIIATLYLKSDGEVMMLSYSFLVQPRLANDPLIGDIPYEVVVSICVGMEKVDKHPVLRNPAACDEWVSEIIVHHAIVVKADKLIDLHFTLTRLFLIPLLLSKDPESEKPVVEVDACELRAIEILLDLFDTHIGVFVLSKLLLKGKVLSLNRVHLDVTLPFLSLGHRDCPCAIVRNYHCLNRVTGYDAILLYQIRKYFAILVKLRVGSNHPSVPLRVPVGQCSSLDIVHLPILFGFAVGSLLIHKILFSPRPVLDFALFP
jgi:hypothetical protein